MVALLRIAKFPLFAACVWAIGLPAAQAAQGSAAAGKHDHDAASRAGDHAAGDHAADPGHGQAAHGGEPKPLAVDPDLALFTVGVFVLLYMVLSKFAWGPVARALEQREEDLSGKLEKAHEKLAEAKQLLADYEREMASAADRVREMLEQARREAEKQKAVILDEAKQTARAQQQRALAEVHGAKDAALAQMGPTAARFALELAGKVVQRPVFESQHEDVIRRSVEKIGQ